MSITSLPANPSAIRLDCIRPTLGAITLVVTTTRVRLLPHLLSTMRRKRLTSVRPPPVRLPAAGQVTRMLPQADELSDEQRSVMGKLCQLFPQIGRARELAKAFTRIVRGRLSTEFNAWLRSAMGSKSREFVSSARGLSEDRGAVMNALRYGWGNGRLEGRVNKLELIKRQMYWRAKFDLSRARVLHTSK